jgi:crotonobetainyl-CoA:carnitine CoA-transferase CaiB-like acyl-CoA transferase
VPDLRPLLAADGRQGAERIWRVAAAMAIALRGRLGGAPSDEEVIEEFFTAPLRDLDDARAGLAVVQCADGQLAVQAPTDWHRGVVSGLADEPEPEQWREAVARWAADQGAEEAAELLQSLGVPAFAVPSRWASASHPLRAAAAPAARGAFLSYSDGFAPQSTVIELGGLWAAPLAAKLLGDLGARVVKVEAPSRPDGIRAGSPERFRALNEGKEILALDLRDEADRERVLGLLGPRAVVVENNTARVLPNLGLAPETILGRGAALVRLPASRLRPEWRGLGSTIEMAAGLGREGADGLTCAPIPFTDPLAGVTAALAAVEALAAEGEGRLRVVGQLEDVALPLAVAAGGPA